MGEQRLMTWFDSSSCKLPYKEWHWQLADDVEHNALITEIQGVCDQVRKAKHGVHCLAVFLSAMARYPMMCRS